MNGIRTMDYYPLLRIMRLNILLTLDVCKCTLQFITNHSSLIRVDCSLYKQRRIQTIACISAITISVLFSGK